MLLYASYLALLVLLNLILLFHCQQKKQIDTNALLEEHTGVLLEVKRRHAYYFKFTYFGVYGLAVAADWLQGPYMYTHYRDTLGLAEATVAALFTTGFVSAGLTATFAGALADRHGRARACLAFCFCYAASCGSVLSHNSMLLFVGRALGGISTTLLYSVFEAWMIAEYNAKHLDHLLTLDDMFSTSVTLSSSVAIASGLVGEGLVSCFHSTAAPFMAAVACLVLAALGICYFWDEHFVQQGIPSEYSSTPKTHTDTDWRDGRIMALALATTIFESCMYIFVFYWTSALTSAHASSTGPSDRLPLGIIFSCFMCAMMLASTGFPIILNHNDQNAASLLLWIFAFASATLAISAVLHQEVPVFWSFMIFEACVGLYFPTMSKLKASIVHEDVRAKVYGLMRLPLNTCVVLALRAANGDDSVRDYMFIACSAQLLFAIPIVGKLLKR